MEPNAVEVVKLIPLDQIVKPSRSPDMVRQPDWRRTFEEKPREPEKQVGAKPILTPFSQMPSTAISTPADWGYAIFYGLVMTVFMGVIWGAIAIATGYIIFWLALIIGYAIAWAVKKGAGTVDIGIIILSVVLTLLAVFIGDIVAITFIAGVSVVDAIGAYPEVIALAPGEICLGYVFGLGGALFAAWSLWKVRMAERSRPLPTLFSSNTAAAGAKIPPASAPSIPPGITKPTATVLVRTMTHARMQVAFPPPASLMLDVDYETMYGIMTVLLDGVQVHKGRIWGAKKAIEVPMKGSTSGTITVRGSGIAKPRIEVLDGGTLIASC